MGSEKGRHDVICGRSHAPCPGALVCAVALRVIPGVALGIIPGVALGIIPGAALGDEPTFRFSDVSVDRGIGVYEQAPGHGSGVAAADFDDDGDVDLFVPTTEGMPNQLYRNLGDGHFEEIGVAAGVADPGRFRVAVWLDYDGDHRLDLFVTGDCWNTPETCHATTTNRLYRQIGDAVFEDVTAMALPDDNVDSTTPHRGGVSAGDLNGDGYLDLVLSLWFGRVQVLINQGDGTFADLGLVDIGLPVGHHWQSVLHDFDGDGRLDVYEAIDFNVNRMWLNQGDLAFEDVADDTGCDNAWNDMGIALGDIDDDGDLEIYVTNIEGPSKHNILYRNDSTKDALAFVEISEDLGVASGGWGWGCTFLDADNDGRLDIAATNGWDEKAYPPDASKLFLNAGGDPLRFVDVSDAIGFNDEYWGSSLIAADTDRDGDLDLIQTTNGAGQGPHLLRILENGPAVPGTTGNHLVIKPRMHGPNHRAIGAIVRVTTGGKESVERMRLITAGTSFLGQEPAEAFFGLGSAEVADRVVVEWPDGRRTELTNVPANQVLTVRPYVFTDVTADAGVGLPGVLTESVAWGDYDNDGDEDLYLTNDGTNRLFRNDGGDVFTDVTVVTGTGNPLWGVGTAFGDLDNDDDLDLYVVNFGSGPDVLYRNDGPIGPGGEHEFTDISVAAGITIDRSSRGVAFIDFDRDGRLDIYVNAIGPDILYRNLGDLRFVNVAEQLGTNPDGQGVGVVATDVDNNGWLDLYNGNRSGDLSNLFLNEGGTFTDVAADAGIDAFGLGMGVVSFDYDNDLDMDLYWTTWPGTGEDPVPNAFYENQGDGRAYLDVAAATGTEDPDGWGISVNAGDVDNDGWMDFFVTNGFSPDSSANVLFRNRAGAAFDDITAALGDADGDGRGVAFADYDGDGDLDIVLTGGPNDETRLWRNDTVNGHHWLAVRLVGRTSNRSGIGARIEVTAEGARTVQEVSGGAGRGSFNSLPVEFGLANAGTVESVYVRWPSGVPQLVTDVTTDALVTITEPIPGDIDGNDRVDAADLLAVLADWGECPASPDYCLADLDASGEVDFGDVIILLTNWG